MAKHNNGSNSDSSPTRADQGATPGAAIGSTGGDTSTAVIKGTSPVAAGAASSGDGKPSHKFTVTRKKSKPHGEIYGVDSPHSAHAALTAGDEVVDNRGDGPRPYGDVVKDQAKTPAAKA